MSSPNHPNVEASNPSPNSKVSRKKIVGNFKDHKLQKFSLPAPLILYIAMNPTYKSYINLVYTCKYFYYKRKVFIFHALLNVKNYWSLCLNPDCKIRHEIKLFDIKEQLWLKKALVIKNQLKPNLMSSLIPRIFRCDLECLVLQHQAISFNDLKKLTKNLKTFQFSFGFIRDGKAAAQLEKIVENLPNIKSLYYTFNTQFLDISASTVKTIIKMPHFKDLKSLHFCFIPEKFDFKSFSEFMDTQKDIEFELCFSEGLSQAYTIEIKAYKEKVKNDSKDGAKIPIIAFIGKEE